jgi:hypothetical protein
LPVRLETEFYTPRKPKIIIMLKQFIGFHNKIYMLLLRVPLIYLHSHPFSNELLCFLAVFSSGTA